MGYVKVVYNAYAVIDDVEYFKIGTVAEIVEKSRQTLQLWDKWSDELEFNGQARLIPKSTRLGKNGVRCWTATEIDDIILFSKNIQYGDIAEFSRKQWGTRADTMTRDLSTKARKEKSEYRKRINRLGKQLEKERKVQQIKSLRADMLATVRARARHIYNDVYK